jgi:tryptophanyl-tRNA synthetase
VPNLPGRVEGNPVFVYHDLFNPDTAAVNDLKELYRAGRVGDSEVKRQLALALYNFLEPLRERRRQIAERPGFVDEILAAGNRRAQIVGEETVALMQEAMGLTYFR